MIRKLALALFMTACTLQALAQEGEVFVSLGEVSPTGELPVYVQATVPVAGFQLSLVPAGGVGNVVVSKGAGGIAQRNGLAISAGATGTVVGVSMSGSFFESPEKAVLTVRALPPAGVDGLGVFLPKALAECVG